MEVSKYRISRNGAKIQQEIVRMFPKPRKGFDEFGQPYERDQENESRISIRGVEI
jgi:hypothetical protein